MMPRLPALWLPQNGYEVLRGSSRWRVLMPLAVFVTTSFLFAPWLLLPAWQGWQAQREQAQALFKQSQQQALRLQTLQRVQAGYRPLQADYERARRALSAEESSSLLQALEDLRAAHGLRQDRYEPEPAIQLECCMAPGYRLTLSGAYAELRGWLEDLSQRSELLLVEQMHWQLQNQDKRTVLQLSLVLRHYQAAGEASP